MVAACSRRLREATLETGRSCYTRFTDSTKPTSRGEIPWPWAHNKASDHPPRGRVDRRGGRKRPPSTGGAPAGGGRERPPRGGRGHAARGSQTVRELPPLHGAPRPPGAANEGGAPGHSQPPRGQRRIGSVLYGDRPPDEPAKTPTRGQSRPGRPGSPRPPRRRKHPLKAVAEPQQIPKSRIDGREPFPAVTHQLRTTIP